MIAPGDRVLVAVSGGQGLARALGPPPRPRLRRRRPVPRARHRRLLRRVGSPRPRVRRERGLPPPSRSTSATSTASTSRRGAVTHRAPCGACGLSKRHLFNQVALESGYDVVATGHNLDDEAAVLLGNVLRWDTDYLGRQSPVLPAAPGFARKVKPLVRLGEREMAGLLRPHRASTTSSTSARWRPATGTSASRSCSTISRPGRPGTKAAFLFGFFDRGHQHFADGAADERDDLQPCAECGAPTPGELCAFCRLRHRATATPGRRSHAPGDGPARGDGQACRGPFAPGDRVLLIDAKHRRHLVTLASRRPVPLATPGCSPTTTSSAPTRGPASQRRSAPGCSPCGPRSPSSC